MRLASGPRIVARPGVLGAGAALGIAGGGTSPARSGAHASNVTAAKRPIRLIESHRASSEGRRQIVLREHVPARLPVHHVAVLVADLARAERFYGGVLGLAVIKRHDDARGAPRSIWFALGDETGAFLAVELATRD